jgi:hypothetical protein
MAIEVDLRALFRSIQSQEDKMEWLIALIVLVIVPFAIVLWWIPHCDDYVLALEDGFRSWEPLGRLVVEPICIGARRCGPREHGWQPARSLYGKSSSCRNAADEPRL